MTPPGAVLSIAAPSSSSWSWCNCSTSAGCRRHRASGRRRNAPSPVQGTSTSVRVKDPGRQAGRVPSATITVGGCGYARTACWTSTARCGATSAATTLLAARAASPANRAVFPPGPAQRSSQRPGGASIRVSAQATSWDPSSCTPARPVRTSSRSFGLPRASAANGDGPPGAAPAASRSAISASPGRTASATGGLTLSARNAAINSSAGSRSAYASTIQRGWAVSRASRSRSSSPAPSRANQVSSVSAATRRSTALTNPVTRSPTVAAAKSTVAATAACTGTRMARIWWAPSRSRSSNAGCQLESLRSAAAAMITS